MGPLSVFVVMLKTDCCIWPKFGPAWHFALLSLSALHVNSGSCRSFSLWAQKCNIPGKGWGQCLHFSLPPPDPFENILLIASLMLECFFTNLLLMHVKLTPTVIGAAQRKSPTRARGSVSHEGPWAIWILLYFIVASEGELIQCCTQNFPYGEGGIN